MERYVSAAKVDDVPPEGFKVVTLEGHAVVLVRHEDRFFALDNRCPHMGFPLHRGSLRNGILTCEWHHARFDLCTGGTFDLFADDARAFPVDVRDGEIWVDVSPRPDLRPYYRRRLDDGLEHGVPLVLAKGAIALLDAGEHPSGPFRIGLEFGTRYRERGWSQGLTMLTCFANLLPYLDADDRPRALYHGLSAVRGDIAGQPARFEVGPLPGDGADPVRLKQWFREFVEVRDDEGAERCLVTAIRSGTDRAVVADMLFSAATDHRFIDVGHVLDFTNKALEALDIVGFEQAELVLTSLVRAFARARRSEESLEWRHPVDVVALLESAFDQIEPALEKGRPLRGTWQGRAALTPVLVSVEPDAIVDGLLGALASGATEDELASAVTYAAALRIARFPTSNEFPDWDTALHTFTFANAAHQGIRRAPSPELLRGVFDAAIHVYLDRFLNAPAVSLPDPDDRADDPEALLKDLPDLLDRQQQVNAAGRAVAVYLQSGGDPDRLLAMLGRLLLREDRDFHSIQTMEAAFRQYETLRGTPEGTHVLAAAARYLAAHAPTVRAQGQTFRIAQRLHRGENVYEDEEPAL
jgi:nitrite reductase/ring-hydroxylating ferredoxin subunit